MSAALTAPRVETALHPPSTIASLRLALCESLADELSQLAEAQRIVEELTGQQDSDSILEREIAERRQAQSVASIADIDAALERIAAGTYGQCESCQRLIAIERLEVIPFARQCVICSAAPPRLIG
jgi:RNA polymerase-binding transcription factor DksA